MSQLSKSVGEIVREYFPDADDKFIDFVMWNKTGWPGFWKGDPEESMREQLKSYKEAVDQGKDVCMRCGGLTEKIGEDICKPCNDSTPTRRVG